MHLCRACYKYVGLSIVREIMLIGSSGDRQVHELHPSHPFLIVPDKPIEEASSESDYSQIMVNPHEELCTYRDVIHLTCFNRLWTVALTHLGVKCAQ